MIGSREARGGRRRPAIGPIVAMVAVLFLSACSDDVEVRDPQGTVVAAGTWSVFDLRPGDCLLPDPEATGEISDVPVVPCAEPHSQEVFATVEHPAGAYPGAGAVSVWADGACLGELESTLDLTLDDGVFVSYLLPTFDGWNKNDDRRAVCVLVFPDLEAAEGSFVAGTAGVTRVEPAPPDLPAAQQPAEQATAADGTSDPDAASPSPDGTAATEEGDS